MDNKTYKWDKIEKFLKEQPNSSPQKLKAANDQWFYEVFEAPISDVKKKKPEQFKEAITASGKFYSRRKKKKQQPLRASLRLPQGAKEKTYISSFGQPYKVSP